MTGGGSLLKGIKEKAQSSFETPVEVADPFSKMEYPAFLEEVLKTAGPEFTVCHRPCHPKASGSLVHRLYCIVF